ncbi:MAG: hypothetical protein ACTFAK_06785 [Candidatus Electronema sp. VV]|uniref:hypothetical protein n=1 Tax=Candidatus Electronema sp. V4 TaxID=3454756 RepID=UPI004055966C
MSTADISRRQSGTANGGPAFLLQFSAVLAYSFKKGGVLLRPGRRCVGKRGCSGGTLRMFLRCATITQHILMKMPENLSNACEHGRLADDEAC